MLACLNVCIAVLLSVPVTLCVEAGTGVFADEGVASACGTSSAWGLAVVEFAISPKALKLWRVKFLSRKVQSQI